MQQSFPRIDPRILRASALTYDLCVSLAAFTCAHIIAFGLPRYLVLSGIVEKTIAFVLICLGSFFLMRLNRGLWRYASIPDMVAIVKAATLAVAIFTIGNFLLSRAENISRVAMVLTWIFVVFGLGAGRIAYRFVKETVFMKGLRSVEGTVSHALLYPFSDTTETYIRAVRRLAPDGLVLDGIIDSRPGFARRNLHGLEVLATPDGLEDLVARHKRRGQRITELVITDPTISGAEMTDLLEKCNHSGIGISRLPDMMELAKAGQSALLTPNPVRLDDLLGRAEVTVDRAAIAAFITGKTVMVTGAGGSIGSELCRQIAGFVPARIVMAELSEHNLYQIDIEFKTRFPNIHVVPAICDIRDARRTTSLMQQEQPDIVFHAAALKHVPLTEANPLEAIKTNFCGTSIVADAALAAGVKAFILISTDKAVNPSSVMGATKRAAELYCQALDVGNSASNFRIVRFGNVLGSAGSVVPLFQQQIAMGGPVTVTDPDVSRFFMTIPEAVSLILEAASQGLSNGDTRGSILILDMGKPIRIADLARRLIQLAGFKPDKEIQISYTGLRPGEKLKEELLSPDEDAMAQRHSGFLIAHSPIMERATITDLLEEIRKACGAEDVAAAVERLREIVPSYHPWALAQKGAQKGVQQGDGHKAE